MSTIVQDCSGVILFWQIGGTYDRALASVELDASVINLMVKWLSIGQLSRSASAVAIMIGMLANPSLAKDPFRTSNPKPISDRTEQAFRALFEKGDYRSAQTILNQADPNEPLFYALKASVAYTNYQGETDAGRKQGFLNEFRSNATQTRTTAQQLVKSDPVRGNIYLATGTFLEGAYSVVTEGAVRGIPQALGSLQQAFGYLDAAERIAPQDPELNLVKGLIDLTLSTTVSLPLSNPNEAIDRLQRYAQPRYVAQRGLAVGYRDLKQFDKALQAVDQAISAAPDNPELSYLKAQILVRSQRQRESVPLFEKALSKRNQLPAATVAQIERELRRARGS